MSSTPKNSKLLVMLVIGAMGAAKDLLHVLEHNGELNNLAFYDDVNEDIGDLLFNTFPILHSPEEAQRYFQQTDSRFTIGIGNPILRKKIFEKFTTLGGEICTTISKEAEIGEFSVKIAEGCNIASGVIITSDVVLQRGVLINTRATLTHDCRIGQFTEISPHACIAGNSTIGDFTFIGANATIIPKIKIGNNVVVAAGAVVTTNIPDNCMVAGTPAVIKKQRPPLSF